MSDRQYTFTEAVLMFPLIGLIGAGLTILWLPFSLLITWVRVQLWAWFVVPYLHFPSLPFWAMFGITTFTGTFVFARATKKSDQPGFHDHMVAMFVNVYSWLIALAVGYIVHTYILK